MQINNNSFFGTRLITIAINVRLCLRGRLNNTLPLPYHIQEGRLNMSEIRISKEALAAIAILVGALCIFGVTFAMITINNKPTYVYTPQNTPQLRPANIYITTQSGERSGADIIVKCTFHNRGEMYGVQSYRVRITYDDGSAIYSTDKVIYLDVNEFKNAEWYIKDPYPYTKSRYDIEKC